MPENQHNRRDDIRPTVSLSWDDAEATAPQLDDVMIDTETLGTAPGSVILSIGAVMFGSAGLGATFYAPILLQSCTDVGLTIDPNTITWWMGQSEEARAAAFCPDAAPLPQVLQAFSDWFVAQSAQRPWCHGATFDIPLLDAAYKACGTAPPWKFWNVRDTRTLYDLAGVKVDRSGGTHHNALDDAKAQAEAAAKALAMLGWRASKSQLADALARAAAAFMDAMGTGGALVPLPDTHPGVYVVAGTMPMIARVAVASPINVDRSTIAVLESGTEPEPLTWESTTLFFTRFITDSRYRKLRPTFQRWYRPICQKCAGGQHG